MGKSKRCSGCCACAVPGPLSPRIVVRLAQLSYGRHSGRETQRGGSRVSRGFACTAGLPFCFPGFLEKWGGDIHADVAHQHRQNCSTTHVTVHLELPQVTTPLAAQLDSKMGHLCRDPPGRWAAGCYLGSSLLTEIEKWGCVRRYNSLQTISWPSNPRQPNIEAYPKTPFHLHFIEPPPGKYVRR